MADPSWYKDGLDHIWLPYTQMKTTPPPLAAIGGEGASIHLADGRKLLDGVSSWWTACHGYNHPHIRAAVEKQLHQIPHLMLGGFATEPGFTLAKRLADMLPGDLNRVFLVESGSVSVEVGMKMAIQYWLNKGIIGKHKIISFMGGYHGDTLGTMSVCDPEEGMHSLFGQVLMPQHVVELPQTNQQIAAFERFAQRVAGETAAILIEPMVQGAGGFRMHGEDTLKALRRIADENNLLLIFDEIMTGFYRLGMPFVCSGTGVVPDIMTLSKSLTGGTLPLAATIATDRVFDAFWDDDEIKCLMHGPTFMGNALACAAANASLDLFETEPRAAQVAAIEAHLMSVLPDMRNLPGVTDVRIKGALGVIEVEKLHDLNGLKARFIEQGIWIRPFGRVIYVMPPFVITTEQLTRMTDVLVATVQDWAFKHFGKGSS